MVKLPEAPSLDMDGPLSGRRPTGTPLPAASPAASAGIDIDFGDPGPLPTTAAPFPTPAKAPTPAQVSTTIIDQAGLAGMPRPSDKPAGAIATDPAAARPTGQLDESVEEVLNQAADH